MPARKRAAIDLDAIQGKELSQITAAEFISALDAGGLSVRDLIVWPEKKKIELWVEPEDFGRVRVGPIIDIIRSEKKKIELEPLPALRGRVLPPVRGLDYAEELTARLARVEAKLGLD